MIRLYSYKGCDSCRKAIKWLKERDIEFENLPIREAPPSLDELKTMLASYKGEIKRLFNVSGQDYRSMGMKDRLPNLSEEEALRLLSENGNLIKRPFALKGGEGIVGFKEAEWQAQFDD